MSVSLPESTGKEYELRHGAERVSATLAGSDSVSRLTFLVPDRPPAVRVRWAPAAGASVSGILSVPTAGASRTGRGTGWVKQVHGKILPFALFRVNFDAPPPLPGSPLVDSSGAIVGLVFQSTGSGGSVYAIPAEAVRRVACGLLRDGRVARGWIGVSLEAGATIPQIVRVWPDSPAAKAGIRPSDVILRIGSRHISDYADAANAFFYLVPEEAVRVKLLRGVDQLEFTLLPTHARPD